MNCEEAKKDFSALLDGELTPDERERVEAHLSECADCLRELDGFKRVDLFYRAMPAQSAPDGFEAKVHAALHPSVVHLAGRRLGRRRVWPLLVSAAMFVLVAGALVYQYRPAQPKMQMASAPVAAEADVAVRHEEAAGKPKGGVLDLQKEPPARSEVLQAPIVEGTSPQAEPKAEAKLSAAVQETPVGAAEQAVAAPAKMAGDAVADVPAKPSPPPVPKPSPSSSGQALAQKTVAPEIPPAPAPPTVAAPPTPAAPAPAEPAPSAPAEAAPMQQAPPRVAKRELPPMEAASPAMPQPALQAKIVAKGAGVEGVSQVAEKEQVSGEEPSKPADETLLIQNKPKEDALVDKSDTKASSTPSLSYESVGRPESEPIPGLGRKLTLRTTDSDERTSDDYFSAPRLVDSAGAAEEGVSTTSPRLGDSFSSSAAASSAAASSAPGKLTEDRSDVTYNGVAIEAQRKQAGKRAFVLRDGVWCEEGYAGETCQELERGSKALSALVEKDKDSGLADALKLGERVIFRVDKTWYKVVPAGKSK